jgi:hypothetical protein
VPFSSTFPLQIAYPQAPLLEVPTCFPDDSLARQMTAVLDAPHHNYVIQVLPGLSVPCLSVPDSEKRTLS